MEESYETFEEELGSPRADPPPQKPVRQIRRPEMLATRKVREEMAPVPQQPRAEPRALPREPSFPRTTPLHRALSIQNLTQIETPWENVTLNRCLFVAITILVLTSGFQRLHETLRGQGIAEEEEVGLTVRRPGTLRHRRQPPEPETTLWEVMFWWLPDLDDEEDEEEDVNDVDEVKRGKSKRKATARAPRGIRNKPLPDKKLMKQREGKLKDRRTKKAKDEEIKDKTDRDQTEEPDDMADVDEDGRHEEAVHKKDRKLEEHKEKKKTKGMS
ncbi:junctional sarcoplasmic reticulum protein 1 isoform X2 [Micropterus dolomieu]|nr:junctional sarcoplasmic reticulum protein 1 isoform X2 [Micropterus dolomieu]XP_045908937.1 junctional sarcoplasmic reticulum protein 1 isoform X2 [Micropterus dolomieu]XP_045908938.1 junctional sarcoplasmic reticulum protein 1 isoform X2 [Micropterus dolomieu]